MPSDRVPLELPSFDDAADERRYRKAHLAAACRVLGHLGFEGVDVTARDPGHLDEVWAPPPGASLRQVRVADLEVALATGLHAEVYAARPDVVAVAQAAPAHSRVFSSQRRLLAPLTQDACAFHGDHGVADGEDEDDVATALGSGKAVLLPDRGHLTVGTTVDAAVWWCITLERSCQTQLLAEAAGTPVPIPPDIAAATALLVGAPMAGWRAFQPLYAWIVEQQPELLAGPDPQAVPVPVR